MSSQQIRGPLGLWPFPLLNAILSGFLGRGTSLALVHGQAIPVYHASPPTPPEEPTPAPSMVRVVEWYDWRGRKRTTARMFQTLLYVE